MLVLASASPRRRAILADLGVPCEVVPSDVDEASPELRALPAAELARELARRKAARVAALRPGRLVLGADTVVALDGRDLGKPADEADARRMLRQLSGRWHEVITGVALARRGPDAAWLGHQRSCVLFRALTASEIDAYVATGEGADKAGSYAVQGLGRRLVAEVRGSYTNVVGLPDVLPDPPAGDVRLADLIARLGGTA